MRINKPRAILQNCNHFSSGKDGNYKSKTLIVYSYLSERVYFIAFRRNISNGRLERHENDSVYMPYTFMKEILRKYKRELNIFYLKRKADKYGLKLVYKKVTKKQ